MMEKEALRVENACGRFLKLAVLDHFNFSANSGEICCLFGAHNAGKTVLAYSLAPVFLDFMGFLASALKCCPSI